MTQAEIDAAIDEVLKQLSVDSGEEYHKLHTDTQSFTLTNGRMEYHENKARQKINKLMVAGRISELTLLAKSFEDKPFDASATIYAQNRIKELQSQQGDK